MISQPSFVTSPSRNAVLLACLVPLVFLCACIALFGVDVLFWDEWMIWGTVLQDLKDGAVSFSTLMAQQNEQRNLAARVFGLALMPLFHLNRFAEYGVMVLLAVATFWGLLTMWRHTARELNILKGRWLPLGMALLVFSTLQWQLFAFGVNTSISLTVLCLVVGVALLQVGRLEPWRVLLLAAVGWIGSFNFANGLFYWICLLPLFFTAREYRRVKMTALAFFVAAGLAAWLVYFHGYVKPPHHPSLSFALSKPLSFIGYFFVYLGGPLIADQNLLLVALCMGGGACCFMAFLLVRYWKESRQLLPHMLPWLVLVVFALMSDGATAVGRAGFGMHQALQSRYVTFANLFWCTLLVSWVVYGATFPRDRLLVWLKRFMTAAFGVFVLGSILCVVVFFHRQERLEKGRQALFSLTQDKDIEGIFPDPHYLRKIAPLFFDARQSVYREVGRLSDYHPVPLAAGAAGQVEELEVIKPGGALPSGLLLRGRAVDPRVSGAPAQLVCIVSGGKIVFAAKPDQDGFFNLLLPSDYFATRDPILMPLAVLSDGSSAAFLEMPHQGAVQLPESWYPPFTIDAYFFSAYAPFTADGGKEKGL